MEIVVGGGGERLCSQNLRDFLRIKEEDHQRNLNRTSSSSSGAGRRSSPGLTLSAVLGEKIGQQPPLDDEPPLQRIQSNRTLLDIIREDQTSGLGRGRGDCRSSWRHLRNKIRLRRSAGSEAHNNRIAMTTRHSSIRFNSNIDSGESTQPDARGPSSHRNPSRATSGRFELTSLSPRRRSTSELNHHHENEQVEREERGGETVDGEVEAEGSPEQPVRMSLMALLAENDRQMGLEGSAYVMDEEEADVEAEETVASAAVNGAEYNSCASGAVNGAEYNSCCVCMVRHKGAAFIPCGHTFCRLCSRELWVQRGNCPLCNNYIVEILDIF